MRVSINVTDFSWRSGIPKGLARLAEAADDAGVDTVWAPDHLLQADPTAPAADRDMLEAYTALGFVAARTERVRLGTWVSAVSFRRAARLVKAINSLDFLT
jgi:alkanesulfonate monooxygenase SsuD/methylene tetrahydromethanopterin reductase-like flavin-dependent oxidoreductase (luciferase family)